MTRVEIQELASSLSLEVERACGFFGCLQQLVHIESKKPTLRPTAIVPLLVFAADGIDLLYKKSGMFLSSVLPDSCEDILANRERTLVALSIVLLVAHTLSRTGETIELIASSSPRTVQIVVQNVTSRVHALNAQTSLNLALAGANMRSQGVIFSWSLKPFKVEMEFQKVCELTF
jgi:hypothetical protein